jgi:tetratricopeptide (TPR) repeat protein
MFARVRRGDLLLAAIALAGIVAGLVLTVAARIGVTGPVLIGAGIVAAAAAAVSGIRAQVVTVVARQDQQRDRLKAILVVPVRVVREVDPFRIGVFPSALAKAAQRGSSAAASPDDVVPPYVPRGVDEALGRALEEQALVVSRRLVVLRGDPKSGKSRSLWEAVRGLPGRRLLAVAAPDPFADASEPLFAPLATLAGLDRPVSGSKGRDLVIWVDDAQAHLRRGLTRDTLRRLVDRYPAAVVALTIHSSALDGLRDIDPPLHEVLRRPFDDLILTPVLRPAELGSAQDAYPALAADGDLVRLPELFAAVNLLTDRYRHHRADEPAGVAVARAAIDWQRAGMPPGSIDEAALRALAGLALQDIAPNRVMDDQAFDRGLAWSTVEVAAFAALVRREPAADPTVGRFRAFDGVVSWARANDPPLGPAAWDFVLEHAIGQDLLGVGVAAFQAAERERAVDAFQRAADGEDPVVAAEALYNKGVALGALGRPVEAVAAYDQVAARFGDSANPALAGQVAWALVNRGVALGALGRPVEAVAAYDQVAARFGDSADPALAEQVAAALGNKGVVLGELGRPEEAVAAYDQVLARFGDSADPALAEQVAKALYDKGVALVALGRPVEAVDAYDQVAARFGDSADPALAVQVAWALVNRGVALGSPVEAVAAYDQVLARFGDSADPALAEQVAAALYNKGVALAQLGRPVEAVAAYDQVLARFGDSADPALAEQVAKALVNKGVALGALGRPEEAVDAYDQVAARFGDSADPAIADWVAAALVNKGVVLGELGRPQDAVDAYDQVLARFGDSADPALAEQVAKALTYRRARMSDMGEERELPRSPTTPEKADYKDG